MGKYGFILLFENEHFLELDFQSKYYVNNRIDYAMQEIQIKYRNIYIRMNELGKLIKQQNAVIQSAKSFFFILISINVPMSQMMYCNWKQ